MYCQAAPRTSRHIGRASVSGEVTRALCAQSRRVRLFRPEVRLSFGDARLLDAGRKQAVEQAIGVASWPPQPGSLMAQVADKMKAWAEEYQTAS